jgi:twinkle protein
MVNNYEISEYNYLNFNLRSRNSGNIKTECVFCQSDRTKNKHDKPVSIDLDKGVYNCHHCDKSGAIHKYKFQKDIGKEYKRPEWRNNTNLSDNVVNWFKGRGISQDTLIKMNITEGKEWMPQNQKEVNTIQFNYFLESELVNIKYRTGDKNFKLFKDAKLIFYNIDSIKECEECIIVEGEMDCLAFIESGITNCISVPNGASKGNNNLQYLDNCYSELDHIKTFYIATDNDEAGLNLRNELLRRLGVERCKKVEFNDCKDANEYLIKHKFLDLLINDAKHFPIDGIIEVNQFEEEIDSLYANGLQKGAITGHNKLDELISYELGRLNVITGIPGHGKSEYLDDILVCLNLSYQWKVALFSPENLPLQIHFAKIAEKLIGKSFSGENKMNPKELKDAKNFINDNFYFIKPTDEVYSLDTILEKTRILVKLYGIRMLVIDPWNKLEHLRPSNMSETEYIGQQLDKIIMFSKKFDILVHLVAHPTKMKKQKDSELYDIPTLYDISGSANFYNKTDFGACVYRNRETNNVDVYIQKVKFKHLGEPGIVEFKYNMNNGRFTDIEYDSPIWDNTNYLIKEYKQENIIDYSSDIAPF